MRISIGVPGVSINFDEDQIKLFLKEKTNELFHEHVVPLVIRGTCQVLEVVANNTADAHDYLIGKLKTKKSA
jgi:hypothetical protein